MYRAMELEQPVYVKNQRLKAKNKGEIIISSLSIPIKSGNRIVGVIDLSAEEHLEEDNNNVIIDIEQLKKINLKNLSLNKNGAKYTLDDIITENFEMKQLKEFIKQNSRFILASNDLWEKQEQEKSSLHRQFTMKVIERETFYCSKLCCYSRKSFREHLIWNS